MIPSFVFIVFSLISIVSSQPCSREKCTELTECRSQYGYCGGMFSSFSSLNNQQTAQELTNRIDGSLYCNSLSTWTSSCNGTLGDCKGRSCTKFRCRSEFGYCGKGNEYCNEKSQWTPSCITSKPTKSPISKSPTTSKPTRPTTFAPSKLPTTGTPTYPPTNSSSLPKFQVGTYFPQWSVYNEFYIKSLKETGQAKQLTFLCYAFANIFKQKDGTYKCDASITREDNNGNGGDGYVDYAMPYSTVNSIDGIPDFDDFPNNDSRIHENPRVQYPLKGNFNQIAKLKKIFPNLKVLLSIGGATESRWFSVASATDSLRKTLVTSCIDQYIKGNLPIINKAGGRGAGFGVFDGIDVDWEFPGVKGVAYNTVDPVNDKTRQIALYKEFRAQLDAYGMTVNRKFYLTAAISSGPESITPTDPGSYSKFLDWINLMTYDFTGEWEKKGPTGFQSNLYQDPQRPSQLSIQKTVNTFLQLGVPQTKIVVGIPFYGVGWSGVKPGSNLQYPGLYQPAKKPLSSQDYKVLKKKVHTVYEHNITKQSYVYDGNQFWSYDTPQNIRAKVEFVKTNQLGGLFSWDASEDDQGELTAVMATGQE